MFKTIIDKIKCFFGFHNWVYKNKDRYVQRWCSDCFKIENGKYDPMYGSVDWE